MTPSLADLTPEQQARIARFKQNHGYAWKRYLATMWETGADERQPDGHLLRQIRNDFGPEWLSAVPSGYPHGDTIEAKRSGANG